VISAVSYHGERNLVKQQNRLLTITAVHELDAEPTWLLVLNVVLLDVGRPPVGHMSAGELNTPHQEAFFPVRLIFCGNCVLWLHRARWTRYTRARLRCRIRPLRPGTLGSRVQSVILVIPCRIAGRREIRGIEGTSVYTPNRGTSSPYAFGARPCGHLVITHGLAARGLQ
jgi:hypothetical protein